MSIIFEGIDPKTDYGLCILTIKGELITANGKHIQAIQIPKGHGRLIDASTETTVESMSGKAMDVGMLLIALKQFVPTILGAEE